MALDKLTILIELPNGKLQFDDKNADCVIVAMFNPNKLAINRSAQWASQSPAGRDNPELHFTGAQPTTLAIDLLFDTYDSPELEKKSVNEYTSKLLHLTTVEMHGGKHRPPVCRLRWGRTGVFFQGVLQQLDQTFTMFMENGTPVRATAHCVFQQWRSGEEDRKRQALMSADVAKVWVVQQGQTLASIAAEEYRDPRKWRVIAEANHIDDPLRVPAGARLVLPALRPDARERSAG